MIEFLAGGQKCLKILTSAKLLPLKDCIFELLSAAYREANPDLMRLALKLATGADKTTVMAMLIAWQTINVVRPPNSKNFSIGFLVVAPGLTIKDRLWVLQPNDPDSCYGHREIMPQDMIEDVQRAKIVITNYHAFKLRAFVPAMVAQGQGSVINLASVGGLVVIRDRIAYCTTKFAVVGLTKSLALDHSSSGVRFNPVCPGRVETPFVQRRLTEYPDPEIAR